MKKTNWVAAALAAIAGAILPACDIVVLPEIKPGITTGVEVRAKWAIRASNSETMTAP